MDFSIKEVLTLRGGKRGVKVLWSIYPTHLPLLFLSVYDRDERNKGGKWIGQIDHNPFTPRLLPRKVKTTFILPQYLFITTDFSARFYLCRRHVTWLHA